MKSWNLAIKDISEYPEKAVRGSLLSMGAKIIKRSPVDTGRFRGNWQFTLNSPAQGQLATTQRPDGELIAATQNWQSGFTFYMTNNLPYGERLEYGWSNQAPSGMVRITLVEYDMIIEQEAQKL